jgi:hypothetical protein
MALFLTFQEKFRYPDHPDGIVIPVTLQSGALAHTADAVVDCGAGVCLFSREIGELLELPIEQGDPIRLRTLSGIIDAFGHEVTLMALNLSVVSVIYFACHEGLPRNLLGRLGWLRKTNFGLVDQDNLVYAGPYSV